MKSQFVYKKRTSHVTKAAGFKVFLVPKMSAAMGTYRLIKDRSQKSGSIQERFLTELAPGVVCFS